MDKSLRFDPKAFAAHPKTIGKVPANRPMTGADYLESLRDGREVYIYGERIDDVTTHPAFRNTAHMTARLYDALHDPEHQKNLILPTDTGNGSFTHAYFKAPVLPRICLRGAPPLPIGRALPMDGSAARRTTKPFF